MSTPSIQVPRKSTPNRVDRASVDQFEGLFGRRNDGLLPPNMPGRSQSYPTHCCPAWGVQRAVSSNFVMSVAFSWGAPGVKLNLGCAPRLVATPAS